MGEVRPFPKAVDVEPDPQLADVITVLQSLLERARRGELSSLACIGLNGAGQSFASHWAIRPTEGVTIIGMLATLQHDLMRDAG